MRRVAQAELAAFEEDTAEACDPHCDESRESQADTAAAQVRELPDSRRSAGWFIGAFRRRAGFALPTEPLGAVGTSVRRAGPSRASPGRPS